MADPVTPPVTPPAEPPATPPVTPPVTPPAEPPKPDDPPVKTELGKPAEKPPEAVPFDAAKLKLPEGMKTDDPLFKSFGELMADDKLAPNDRGQKLIDLYHGAVKQAGEANTLAWQKVNETWIGQVKADAEIGGAKFETTKTSIARTIDLLGPDKASAFRQALDVTGIGNNPAFWHGMAAFAKLLTEGGHVAGSPAGSGRADMKPADFFPNSKMNG